MDGKVPAGGAGARCCPLAEFEVPPAFAQHPGGQLALETAKRSECPGLLFLSYHMGSDLDGKVAPAAHALGTKMPERGKMYDEMQAAIRKVKLAHPEVHRQFRTYCLVLTAALLVAFVWWYAAPGVCISIAIAAIFELYFLNVFHARHHMGGRLYKDNYLHRLTTPLYNFVEATWGYYPHAWRFNHHVRHHVYTNDKETDSDVPSMWPLVRSCRDQPQRWFHKAQTFYWPFLMPFTAVSFPVQNVTEHGGDPLHFVAWLLLMFVFPVALHGWPVLAYSFLALGMSGGSLAYTFAVSHAHNDLKTESTSKESYEHIDAWLRAQIEESMSYGGFLTTFVFGGINMQVEHHIAPALDPPLYSHMAPEIKRICEKYGVKYTSEPSFGHAVWQFHLKLWSMGWW